MKTHPPTSARLLAVVLAVGLAPTLGCSTSAAESPGPGSEEARILEWLSPEPGDTVADVGAGDGDFTVLLAGAVGPLGKVWATEVEQDHVDDLADRAEREGLGQIAPVLGDQERTGLPASCCRGILLRKVYHHFTDPATMGAELWRALEPGGLLLVIDFPPQEHWSKLEGVPERGGHGVKAEEIVKDLGELGFEKVRLEERWEGEEDDEYALLFRRP